MDKSFFAIILGILPLIPLFGSALSFLLGKSRPSSAGITATLACAAAFGVTVFLTQGLGDLTSHSSFEAVLFPWMSIGSFSLPFAYRFDALTAVMCLVITGIGTLIHLYSIGYMKGDEGYGRFFSYLNLFVAAMLILVIGANLPVLFIGWEGVGLCSYLLIGFWHSHDAYTRAGLKAFVVNRIGDACFLIGMFLLVYHFGTLDFLKLQEMIGGQVAFLPLCTLVAFLFFLASTGKSAQIPLFVWLPDAMAGPTPVSALIHAATMVTAGVYLTFRLSFLYQLAPFVNDLIVVVAVLTAFVAATIAVVQTDIKRVLAYSTVSQLGFMFVAVGVGQYWVALFHLVTHAFFKACLFLGAGSVIHACHHEQEMSKFGGLRKYLPLTFATYLVSTFAIAGVWPFSGFFSKHLILEAVQEWSNRGLEVGAHSSLMGPFLSPMSMQVYAYLLQLTALLTAFYMTRSLVYTFFGSYRGGHHHEEGGEEKAETPHESPAVMVIPLLLLGVGAVVSGILLEPRLSAIFGEGVPEHSLSSIEGMKASLPALISMAVAALLFLRAPGVVSIVTRASGIIGTLFRGKYFFDEIYDLLIVRPLHLLSRLFRRGVEEGGVEGLSEATGYAALGSGEILRWSQSGDLRFAALGIFLSCSVLLLFLVSL